jgi:hypothetical protein
MALGPFVGCSRDPPLGRDQVNALLFDHLRTEVTRQKASRAGSLRDVGGLGETDTCVANGNPSKT